MIVQCVFSHLGVFLISVKPLTTGNTENKTTPKIFKITVSTLQGLERLNVWKSTPESSLYGCNRTAFDASKT